MRNLIKIPTLFKIFFFTTISIVWADPPSVKIDLTRQTHAQVSVAVLPFQKFSDLTGALKIAQKNRKILENDLRLLKSFSVLPESRYQAQVRRELDPTSINHLTWEELGAQWVVTTQFGTNTKTKNAVFVFRLFDAVNKRFLVGKRYRGNLLLAYRIMHRFADEMVEQLTGKRGVADTHIAYVGSDQESKEIYTIGFDGKNRQKITNDQSIALKPTWSPDGNRMVFTSYAKKNPKQLITNPNLVMVDIFKNQRWSILTLPGLNAAPAWSPDGSKIALVLSRDRNSEIYYLTKKRKLSRLTSHFNIDMSPTWSPDGKKIAFTSDRSGTGAPQIYIMEDLNKREDGPIKRITFDSSYNDNPAWSPSGENIAYTSLVGRQFRIRIYNLKNKKTTNFTTTSGNFEEPSWSPDGRFLIYRQHEKNGYGLYIKKLGGIQARRLTSGLHPSWSPYLNQ